MQNDQHQKHASGAHESGGQQNMKGGHYGRLVLMTVVSFIAMYILMYAMVNEAADVYSNVNQIYMAGLMTAAMVVIELLLMSGMYPNKRANALLIAGSVVALVACFAFIRRQTAVGDRQFLKSMIPHHASAILMCQQASIQDPQIQKLCGDIVRGQQAEIDQMKQKLRDLQR